MADIANIPCEITAGLSFSIPVSAPEYPSDIWTLVLHLRGPSQANVPLDGLTGNFVAAPSVTADWKAGRYYWAIRAASNDDVRELQKGELTILPDIAATGSDFDGRSQAERTLDAVNAVIEGRASIDQERYRINNRELYRTPISDLLKLQTHYRRLVATEKQRAAGNRQWGRRILVRLP